MSRGAIDPASSAAPGPPGEAWLAVVVAAVAEVVGDPERPVTADDHLVGDLGLDSLGAYELAVHLDGHVPGFELPEDLHPGDTTVRDVAHYLALAASTGDTGQS